MSEDLNFHGNELVQFQTIFVIGNVLGLLPFAYLFPRVPMHYLVPALDFLWGIFNLVQYQANSYSEIMAFRFMVSFFEVKAIELPLFSTETNVIGFILAWSDVCAWIMV